MKHLAIALLGLVLLGCNTLRVSVPAARMESPEASRTWHPRISTGVSQQTAIVYASDASSRPYTYREPNKDVSYDYAWIKAGIGFPLGFEISGKVSPLNTLAGVSLKFQIFGPRAGEGKAGDTSLAVTGAYYNGGYDTSGDQNGIFGRGGHNWSANARTTGLDAALIVGHRVSDRIIFYGGPFYYDQKFNGTIRHEQSDDGLSPAAVYELRGEGVRRGVNLAMEWQTMGQAVKFYLGPEIVISSFKWTNKEEATHFDWGLTTGLIF